MNKSIFTPFLILLLSVGVYAQSQTGKASFYADKFEGRTTASGEKYKHSKLTAAHKTLPFGTKVKVTNLANNQEVEVVINDRGPYVDGRIIDLSKSAAEKLGFINLGLADVKMEVIDAGDGKGKTQPVSIEKVSVDEKEFYELSISRLKPAGFGVQIGTYQELVNLMRLSENLKNSYKRDVTIQVKVINGVKYYSIILGQFSKRSKAGGFLADIKKKFPDAFIVEFDRL
ncbi:MAG TPA: septal ring lytic transglycosylase RlpA family lipoprotein [Cytophagales bacterium]|nr:septal ring lytic transglycosylase RlpA family lipoprotein [Cytophagales bacterium]